MEIVHAFPGPDGLQRFREWLDAPDEELVELAKGRPGSAGKPGRGGRKQRQRQGGGEGATDGEGEEEAEDVGGGHAGQAGAAGTAEADLPEHLREADPEAAAAAARLAVFKRTHRGVRRSWDPPASFPSAAVDQAYAEPKVDSSKEK